MITASARRLQFPGFDHEGVDTPQRLQGGYIPFGRSWRHILDRSPDLTGRRVRPVDSIAARRRGNVAPSQLQLDSDFALNEKRRWHEPMFPQEGIAQNGHSATRAWSQGRSHLTVAAENARLAHPTQGRAVPKWKVREPK